MLEMTRALVALEVECSEDDEGTALSTGEVLSGNASSATQHNMISNITDRRFTVHYLYNKFS